MKAKQWPQQQKPQGMAWGAAGSSRKRSNQDNNQYGDFGRYMDEKKRKLNLQFQADAYNKDLSYMNQGDVSSSSDNLEIHSNAVMHATGQEKDISQLFQGVRIFVDGYTIPSHQELRTLMLKHGGAFENYFSRDSVTHIICSNLPDSKIRDHRSFSRGLPIVKPSWIVDSINSGKLLSLSSYYHERIVRSHPNQSTISTFLDCNKTNAKENSVSNNILPFPEQMKNLESGIECNDQVSLGDVDSVLDKRKLDQEFSSSSKEDIDSHPGSEIFSDHVGRESKLVQPKEKSSLENIRSHCTLSDANFVQNYFKNSRLHFIGTWRTRYQNRYKDRKLEEKQNRKTNSSSNRTIMHIDMDCFFVSVVVRNRPQLAGKPVAVCHSEKTNGTAEISSSNYPARSFGVKSGMFICEAKSLCPDLEIVPYDFEAYHQVADQFYDILHRYCDKVQAVSCDEAFLDITGIGDPEGLASIMRKEIVDQTRCTASVGIGNNLLLARLATRKAKPDGQFKIDSDQVENFISDLLIKDLPGVGWSLQEKLHNKAIYNCAQLRTLSKDALQNEFGAKTGEMLWCFARGIDDRQVQEHQERKSVGADVNWGVRFESGDDAQHFLASLCSEVTIRLQNAGVCGRTFTLKVKKRKEGAGEPQKFMGCGSCDNLSKSITLASATSAEDVILRISKQMFASFHLDVREIRGMGLQVTKLEPNVTSNSERGQPRQKALESCMQFVSKESEDYKIQLSDNVESEKSMLSAPSSNSELSWGVQKNEAIKKKGMQSLGRVLKGPFSARNQDFFGKDKGKQKSSKPQNLPDVSELDPAVLASLPPEILQEIDKAYNGAVGKRLSAPQPEAYASDTQAGIKKSNEPIKKFFSKQICKADKKQNPPPVCKAETSKSGACNGTLMEESMPLSLSQIDMATLDELPADIREDILKGLSGAQSLFHKHETTIESGATLKPAMVIKPQDDTRFTEGSPNLDNLWSGSPPRWVSVFMGHKHEGADILCLFSERYLETGSATKFSSTLLHVACYRKLSLLSDLHSSVNTFLFTCCLELIKQYVKAAASSDLEDVYATVHILKRLAGKFHFWQNIYEYVIPIAQAATSEWYGGKLYCGV